MQEEEQEEFNPEFEEEGTGYSRKAGFDKAGLVHQAVQTCFTKRAQEMRPGERTTILDKNGNPFPKLLPDTRIEFISSVDGLTQLLKPEIKRFKEMNVLFEKFMKDKLVVYNRYVQTECDVAPKRDEKGSYVFDNTKTFVQSIYIPKTNPRKWLPSKDDKMPVLKTLRRSDGRYELNIEYVTGLYNSLIDSYWNELLILYDNWFGELNCLISDKMNNYSASINM